MKKVRFTEAQIIGVLKEAEAGMKVAEICPQARHLGSDLLQLENQIQRHDGRRGTTPQSARSRERQAQEIAS